MGAARRGRPDDGAALRREGKRVASRETLRRGLAGELDPATVFYTRAGVLSGGNLRVE